MAKGSKRIKYVTVRVTEEQCDALDRAAQERHCDRSEYVRSKLFDGCIPENSPPPTPANDTK
ncbi:MAG: hypothetical protein Q8R82_07155 [Hyphomonadaceae bacterium]|nr:hypothetical protein [Hyphomonadaceae bacterium]